MAAAVDAFLRLELAGKSDETVRWYATRLQSLVRALDNPSLVGVQEVDLLAWRSDLLGTGRSPHTIHGYIRAARRLFGWLAKKEILPANLAGELELIKLPKNGKKGISDRNVERLLEAALGNADPLVAARDYAILKLLDSTGARVGGLAHLGLSDLELDDPDERSRRRLVVHEKGDKERPVFMTASALEALEAWLDLRPEVDFDEVFLGRSNGRPWEPLSEHGFGQMIARYKKRLGLKGRCNPHEWRHRWCRKRIREGMNLSLVSQLAGHSSVDVTVRFYGQFDDDQLQDVYDQYVRDD